MNSLPHYLVEEYWQAITPIEAQRALLDISISSYPHLKGNSQRENLHRDLHKKAYPIELNASESIDIKDYFNQIGSQGWQKQGSP